MSGFEDPVLDGIADSIKLECPDEIVAVSSYIVAAEWIDKDGEKQLFFDSMEDQRRVTSLGLLAMMDATERGRIAKADAEDT